jgi:hypothetical protein
MILPELEQRIGVINQKISAALLLKRTGALSEQGPG